MLVEIVLALLIGIIAGTLTGLIPGIHINLIGVFLVSLSASLLFPIHPIYLVVFIASMAITHTFIDFIPSVFLGCPDTDTELSVLPGHELLKKGMGYEAITLTAYGSIIALYIIILISQPFFVAKFVLENIFNFVLENKILDVYHSIKFIIPFLLIIVSVLLISMEKKKLNALFAFLLAGFLGWSVLNFPSLEQPVLPLLTGLFGSSMLILSIKNKFQIPKQKITKPATNISKPIAGAFLGSLVASPLCSFLPGLGSGQAAIIGNTISRTDRKGFLVLLGATNTLVMGFSFISLYLISRTRTGAAVAIQQIFGTLSWQILLLVLIVTLVTGTVSFFLTKALAKSFSQKITKINYTYLALATLAILIVIVFLVSGFLGLLVLAASTLTGIYCISLKVRRTQMMGCLLIPTIIFYLI